MYMYMFMYGIKLMMKRTEQSGLDDTGFFACITCIQPKITAQGRGGRGGNVSYMYMYIGR